MAAAFQIRFAVPVLFLLAACSPAERDAETTTSAESALEEQGVATIRFNADWSVKRSGKLLSGRKVRIEYANDRMPSCRGEINGGPGWSVTGHYRIGGGEPKSFWAAGHKPAPGIEPVIDLPAFTDTADLEIWFENVSRWGCQAWDSNYGDNFHFDAKAPPEAPQWIGNVRYVSSRMTCGNGNACDSDRREIPSGGFLFESWSRQRAAINEVSFQVYEPGVTDWDNANAWRDLDVKVFTRWTRSGDFSSAPVNIDGRVGNDIRYHLDTRAWDPFKWPVPTSRDQCPQGVEHDGSMLRATVEFYFTVNGVEVRPAPGKSYLGKYEINDHDWSACVP